LPHIIFHGKLKDLEQVHKIWGQIWGQNPIFLGGKMKLTKTLCNKLEPKSKPYKRFDGGGLYLEIMPNGSKLWRLKYYYQGKEKRLSFGKYPTITLVNARMKRIEAHRLLEKNVDPSKNKIEKEKLARRSQNSTFEKVAQEWFEKKKGVWSESHCKHVWNRLSKNVFPYVGKEPISKISPPDLLDVLKIMEQRNALELAGRTRQICGQVFSS
jgi:hypothetical protein